MSAAQVIPDQLVGDYRDLATLRQVTEGCAVVTFDHEHVPTEHLHALETAGVACRPGPEALVHAQDKIVMRTAMARLGAPQPRWDVASLRRRIGAFGLPCVLKVSRGGYDGKGVWVVRTPDDIAEPLAVAERTGVRLLAEELVDFRREPPRWWRARPAARRRRTPSSPAPSSTASAMRSSHPRPTSTPPSPAMRSSSRSRSPASLG